MIKPHKFIILFILIFYSHITLGVAPYLSPNTLQFQKGSGWQIDSNGELSLLSPRIINIDGDLIISTLNNQTAGKILDVDANLNVTGTLIANTSGDMTNKSFYFNDLRLSPTGALDSLEVYKKDKTWFFQLFNPATQLCIHSENSKSVLFQNGGINGTFLKIFGTNSEIFINSGSGTESAGANFTVFGSVSIGKYMDQVATSAENGDKLYLGTSQNGYVSLFRHNVDANNSNLRIQIGQENLSTQTPGTNGWEIGILDAGSSYQSKRRYQTDGDISVFSDKRLKTSIKKYKTSFKDLSKIQGVSFHYKGSKTPQLGFIAQNIAPIYPDLVMTNQSDEKFLNYEGFTPILVNATNQITNQLHRINKKIATIKATLELDQQ